MQPDKVGPHRSLKVSPPQIPPVESDFQVKRSDKRQSDVPSVSSEQVLPPEKHISVTSGESLNHLNSSEMERLLVQIEQDISTSENMADLPPQTLEELGRKLVELEVLAEVGDVQERVLGVVKAPADAMKDYVMEPYELIAPFVVDDVDKTPLAAVSKPLSIARTTLLAGQVATNGAIILIKKKMCEEAEKELEKANQELQKFPNNEDLKNHIQKLKLFIIDQRDDIKDRSINFFEGFVTVSLKTTNLVLGAIKTIAPMIKAGIGWAVSMLDVLGESISLWRSGKVKTTHETWMTEISKNPQQFERANELLAKRQERMIIRKIERQEIPFEDLKNNLDAIGIDISNVSSLEDFKKLLSTNGALRNQLSSQYLDEKDKHEETLSVMTRNAAQALSQVKAENQKKFYDFKIVKSKISLALACLAAATAIALEVLVIVGIIAATSSFLLMPGIGFLLLGVALAAVGLYFLYKHRPNLFKCFIRAVNLRVAFFSVPVQLRSLQLKRRKNAVKLLETKSARYEQLKGFLKLNDSLNNYEIPKEFEKVLKKLRKDTVKKVENFDQMGTAEQIEKLQIQLDLKQKKIQDNLIEAQDKESEIALKLDYWIGKEGKLTKLQNRLTVAGNKDFALANRLVEQAVDKSSPVKTISIPQILADSIVDGNLDLDEEIIKIFKEKFEIDIRGISKSIPEDKKEKIKNELSDFFKMDDDEFLGYMKKRLKEIESQKPIEG